MKESTKDVNVKLRLTGAKLSKFKRIQKETGNCYADLIVILFDRGLDGWDENTDGF